MPHKVARRMQGRATSSRYILRCLAAAAFCIGLVFGQAPQNAPAAQPTPRTQFFAGNVAAIDDQHITVSRTLVGHPTEKRTFAITPNTKMKKSLVAPNARVTVRYQHLDEGDVALEVQVHAAARAPKPS